MNFNDRAELAKKLTEMATVVGRTVDDVDIKAYFNQLEEYPIELILKGMDMALRSRDPEDLYLQNTLVTVPEIRAAIIEASRPADDQPDKIALCRICHGQAWIMGLDEKKRAIAWPCECLYKSAKETLTGKKRMTLKRVEAARNAKRIISAYEYHEKKWGGEE